MRAAIRLLVALTLLAWGQFSFATDYYWYWGTTSITIYKTPLAACTAFYAGKGYSDYRVTPVSASKFKCEGYHTQNKDWYFDAYMNRYGDSCPAGSTYNASTGACDAPKDCSAAAGKKIFAAAECAKVSGSKLYSCPRSFSKDGCEYLPSGTGNMRCQSDALANGKFLCAPTYIGSGAEAGEGVEECTESTCVTTPGTEGSGESPSDGCISAGGKQVCITDEEKGCGTINGQYGCFEQEKNCGTFNGTFQCVDQNKSQNNCGYFNGKQICFDPSDPTKIIDPSSPDHPANGGNADGNQNNDPMAPGGTPGSSPQSGSSGATNQAINDLGEKLGPKIDKTNSLLETIIDKLFGTDYDNSGDGSDSEAEVKGGNAGDAIAAKLKSEGDRVQQEHEGEVQSKLDGIPTTVDSWFGGGIDLGNALNRIFPSASGCGIYSINFALGKYTVNMSLDTCILSRMKSLLEWLVWCWTIIAVWKIFYSGLRLEDAKAAKQG
uniref:hypothetical protein n=1 Tax=Pseudomonas sp. RW407 TaxID=2202894 RepID=UPI0011B75CB7|nr:hypothetical protein [Pseudomonas sp. RW407]